MLAKVCCRHTVASYFLRPGRLQATLDNPLLSLPGASVAPALYLVPPPGVAALWEQDSWNAVGTTPQPALGTPLPAQARIHAPPGLCSRVSLSYLHGEVTVHNLDSNPDESYGAQSHIPRGGVLRPRGSQITLPTAERRGPREVE